jgi:hypothetical protein
MKTATIFLKAAVVALVVAFAIVRFIDLNATNDSVSDIVRPWVIQVGGDALAAFVVIWAIGRVSRRGSSSA